MIIVGCESNDYHNYMYSELIDYGEINIKVRGVTRSDLVTIQELLGCQVDLVKHVSKEDQVEDYKRRGMLK